MGRGRMGVRERKQVEVEEVEVGVCGR